MLLVADEIKKAPGLFVRGDTVGNGVDAWPVFVDGRKFVWRGTRFENYAAIDECLVDHACRQLSRCSLGAARAAPGACIARLSRHAVFQ